MTTAATTDVEKDPFYDADDPGNYAVRRHLGLRPLQYREEDGTADPRPCPSWCWVGQSEGGYQHEVDPRRPLEAHHSIEGWVSSMASLYEGQTVQEYADTPRHVATATYECHLEQVGQGDPRIRVYLRHYKNRGHHFEIRNLLSIDDARELAMVLNHLVEVADAG